MFQILFELFSQAGKIEFEFSGIFRLSYLFSKLCLYIPIACVLSHFFTLLANFLAIVIPESELKVLALLVALISFLTSVSLEYYSLNRVTSSGIKEKYIQQGFEEIRSFCCNHEIKSETDFYKILFKAFNKLLTSDLFKNVKHEFWLIFLPETIFIMPLAVLAVFKFFGMDITPLVAILSFAAIIPLFFLFRSKLKKLKRESDKASSGGGLECILILILGLFWENTIRLPFTSVGRKYWIYVFLAIILAPPWFPFLRVKNAFPELRTYIITITPKDLKRRDYTKLVGWFYPADEKKQARLSHQDSLQEDGDLNLKTDRKDFLETLGYIAYKCLHKEFQDTYGIILEDKGGLIYLRNKSRGGLTSEDEFRIFYYYFDWVRNKLNSFRSAQKDQKLTIKSLGELDPDVLPDLFKNAVPKYRELSDYKALFDEEIIEALGDLGKRTIIALATFEVEYVEINFSFKGQFRSRIRNLTEMVGAFFVLPIVYVFTLDENFEDLQNEKA
jgi:hypothetical protein